MSDPSPGAAIGSARLRREARERALELLYEREVRGGELADLLASLPLEPEAFTVELLEAEATHRERSVELATPRLRRWTWDRLPLMDRLVLRLAIGELLGCATPTGVVLAEAVDLAARYGTDDSSRFVNGLLANVAAEIRS